MNGVPDYLKMARRRLAENQYERNEKSPAEPRSRPPVREAQPDEPDAEKRLRTERALSALTAPGGRAGRALAAFRAASNPDSEIAKVDHVASAVTLQLGEDPMSWREWLGPVADAVEVLGRERPP